MSKLLGEFDCKIDVKGRMRMPSQLLKQLGNQEQYVFVVNRGIDKCLTLYPKQVWDEVSAKVDRLNTYIKKNRDFVRFFYRGATEVTTDGADRILLTKKLLEYADIDKEVTLSAKHNFVEIWDKAKFEEMWENEDSESFSELAEDVMGGSLTLNEEGE